MSFGVGRTTKIGVAKLGTLLAIGALLVTLGSAALVRPHVTSPEVAQLPRPYFSQSESWFGRGNLINLDTAPDATDTSSSTTTSDEQPLVPPEQLWTVAGTNTVSLNWTRQAGASGYHVHYRPASQASDLTAEVAAPFFTVRNAKPNTSYEFAVASVDEKGIESPFSARMAVTPTSLTSTTRIERADLTVGAWLPPGWENSDVQASFERASGTLSVVNPFWYNFSSSGQLEAKGSAKNPEVVARAHQAGMRVIVTVTNNYDPERVSAFLKNSELQERFIQDVATELGIYNYDGIDLDFENVHTSDKEAFTDFVLRLAAAVHKQGKVIELTAQAKKSDTDTWDGPGALDLERLREEIDRFKPMLYDFARPDTEPGALAPLAWIREVLGYWKSKVPAEKIQAALPLYGYDWSLSSEDDIGIQYVDVQHIKSKYKVSEALDPASGEVKLSYSDEHGPRTVFYQNAASVQQKVATVRAAGISAVTFWLLGGEDPQTFEALRAATSKTTVSLQKPLNIGLKLKGSELAVSVSKFPEIDHVTVLYGAAPDALNKKLEKQTTSLITLPALQPGETRYIQAIAYDKKGAEIKKSGIAFIDSSQQKKL
ncbi:MAG: glycosyl hydrolase family 18 protein [Candidatus Andersenbacteria bacterium]